MVTEYPEIARVADRSLRRFRHSVLVGVTGVVSFIRQQLGQFQFAEADQIQIEIFRLQARSSMRSGSSSQPAFSASWLSAITSARRCASVRCPSTITGTSVSPSFFAAANRA